MTVAAVLANDELNDWLSVGGVAGVPLNSNELTTAHCTRTDVEPVRCTSASLTKFSPFAGLFW